MKQNSLGTVYSTTEKHKISQTDLVHEFRMKFGIAISRKFIRSALKAKEDILTVMENVTKAGKER